MNNWRFEWPEKGIPLDDDYAVALADAEGEVAWQTSIIGMPGWPSGAMCEKCGGFVAKGLKCKRCPPEGKVKCPADSAGCVSVLANAEKCVLCRGTGFVEELNNG